MFNYNYIYSLAPNKAVKGISKTNGPTGSVSSNNAVSSPTGAANTTSAPSIGSPPVGISNPSSPGILHGYYPINFAIGISGGKVIITPVEEEDEVDILDGCICKSCGEFYQFAEPNQIDGTLVCWSCRNYY
jgi:hypothetical protein